MSLLTLLDSQGVIVVGDDNFFIVCCVIPARAAVGHRGEALDAGATKVVVIGDSGFQKDLQFALGSRLFIARRYDQNMVYQQYPYNLLDSQSVDIG